MFTDPQFILVALPAVTFLGLSKGGFGGLGMAATPLVALVVPPLQAAAILLPILMVQDAISLWTYRRDWSGWNLKVMLPGAVVGIGVAWLLAAHVSDAAVRLFIGLTGLAFVLTAWFGRPPEEGRRPSALAGAFWGSLAGFTSTLTQAGSPPFQIFVLPQRLDKLALVGTSTIFFAAVNALKVVPYFALDQFSSGTLQTSLALLPLAVLTNFLGIWLVRRTPTALFYRIAYWLVFFISLALTWQGAGAFWRG